MLGHPSYVWREGQERRLSLIRQYAPLEGKHILDVGCGLGMYVRRFLQFSDEVYGVDIDEEKVAKASQDLAHIQQAPAEILPFADETFDVILSHEVLEHVENDRAAVVEAYRVLKPGGRLVVFAPNRGYAFETHGFYWRGQYHYGNIPLINYLPNPLRNRFCPHVRVYTYRGIRRLFQGLDGRFVIHRRIFAGYDNIAASHPRLARLLRGITYALERTPLQWLGLSHLIVFERVDQSKDRTMP